MRVGYDPCRHQRLGEQRRRGVRDLGHSRRQPGSVGFVNGDGIVRHAVGDRRRDQFEGDRGSIGIGDKFRQLHATAARARDIENGVTPRRGSVGRVDDGFIRVGCAVVDLRREEVRRGGTGHGRRAVRIRQGEQQLRRRRRSVRAVEFRDPGIAGRAHDLAGDLEDKAVVEDGLRGESRHVRVGAQQGDGSAGLAVERRCRRVSERLDLLIDRTAGQSVQQRGVCRQKHLVLLAL